MIPIARPPPPALPSTAVKISAASSGMLQPITCCPRGSMPPKASAPIHVSPIPIVVTSRLAPRVPASGAARSSSQKRVSERLRKASDSTAGGGPASTSGCSTAASQAAYSPASW
ncbi:MAG: hypothetical protein DIU80_017580 [Chloroflexota bacterium]